MLTSTAQHEPSSSATHAHISLANLTGQIMYQ